MPFTTSGQETERALFLQRRSPHGAPCSRVTELVRPSRGDSLTKPVSPVEWRSQSELGFIVLGLSGGSREGARGAKAPPLVAWKIFFASILILLLSRLHTMDLGNTKVAVCRRFLLSNRLVLAAFCCLCAVHCMQAAAASFVSPKAVFLACKIGSWTAKNSAQNALEVDIFRSKVKKIFWGPPSILAPAALDLGPPVCKFWIRHCSGGSIGDE